MSSAAENTAQTAIYVVGGLLVFSTIVGAALYVYTANKATSGTGAGAPLPKSQDGAMGAVQSAA
jgi:hypothetical protein